ncbi:oligosaccharide flippase family protein [Paenibacillus sp. 32O-W]|uniref:oligosaccharide flippase family protein n=1 Tax=Paenibacillus sp. 32O-W TaxID=1695218 RepID=UPI0007847178|nr:oligosaccharide flippase family protein [Paenibacillus sp. 32O-W]
MRKEARRTGNTKGDSWLNGALVMGVAALVSKGLGTLQKIPLQNMAGDRVFGIYHAVYPFYQLLLVVATAGVPVAVSLLVAERAARGDAEGANRLYRAGLLLMGAAGAAACAVVWNGADKLAVLTGDSGAAWAFRIVSLSLLVVPALSVVRGVAQGLGRLRLSAASQVAEQTVRVSVMLLLLAAGLNLGWSDERLAAGAMAGTFGGGACALALLAVWAGRQLRQRAGDGNAAGLTASSRTPAAARRRELLAEMRNIAAVAIPAALGAIAVPVAAAVDAFTVPRLLAAEGLDSAEAMSQFGVYSRGGTVVQLVVMVAGSASAALVPALAAARARGDGREAGHLASLAMRAAWWLGGAAALGIAMLAGPINRMLFADGNGTALFALVGCTALAGALNAVCAALLQSLGAARVAAWLMVLAALLKGALNAALIPRLGIAGAAWAGIAALTAAALLAAAAVRRAAGAPPRAAGAPVPAPLRVWAGTALALAALAAALTLSERVLSAALAPLPPRAAAAVQALTGTAVGACVFAAVLLRSGGIGAREWRALPGGAGLAARLRRWRLLPRGE